MNKFLFLPITARLFLLALGLRLIPVLISINLPIGLDDMFQYDMLGRSLAAGNGFRWYSQPDLDLIHSYVPDFNFIGDYDPRGVETSFRAPGYPAFLAAIYSGSGLEWRLFAARLGNALLGATLAPMAFALAIRLFPKKPPAAVFAGYAIAIYPMLIIYPLALATENLFIPLALAGLLLLVRASESQQAKHFVFAGVLLGAATLTRSVIFGFAGLAFLWVWLATKQRRGALFFLLAVIATVLPWTIRNSLLHGRPTFVENSLGYNLHMGFHPEGNGSFQYGISLELVPYLDDGLRNELGTQAGIEFIRNDPGRAVSLVFAKLGYFFSLERRALTYFYSSNFFGHIPQAPLIALFLLFTLPFTLLSSMAAFAAPFIEWTKERILLLIFLLAYLAPHLILIAEDRFHLAIVPVLAVLAGYAWSARREISLAARANKPKLVFAVLLVSLLWLNWGLELWRDQDKLAILVGPQGNVSYFSY